MKLGSTLSPKFFRHVSTSAARRKSESEGKLSTIRCRPGKRQIQGDQAACRREPALLARVTRDCRVLGVLANDIVIWFWFGSHDNYERLIRELR